MPSGSQDKLVRIQPFSAQEFRMLIEENSVRSLLSFITLFIYLHLLSCLTFQNLNTYLNKNLLI